MLGAALINGRAPHPPRPRRLAAPSSRRFADKGDAFCVRSALNGSWGLGLPPRAPRGRRGRSRGGAPPRRRCQRRGLTGSGGLRRCSAAVSGCASWLHARCRCLRRAVRLRGRRVSPRAVATRAPQHTCSVAAASSEGACRSSPRRSAPQTVARGADVARGLCASRHARRAPGT